MTIQSNSPRSCWLSLRGLNLTAVGNRRQIGRLQRADPRTGTRWIDFPNDPPHLVHTGRAQRVLFKRRVAREQFVEQHAQRIDVAARIDIHAALTGLLGAHVERRAHHLTQAGVERLLGQLLAHGFGDAKVDDLGHRPDVMHFDQHVTGLEIAVDHAFLMRVLHAVADA